MKPLPHKLFLKTFKYAPRIAVDVLLIERKTFALTRRSLPPFKGHWHIPGSFLLKDETIHGCIRRILKKELGMNRLQGTSFFMGIFEDLDQDPRGHVIDLVYGLKNKKGALPLPTKESEAIRFFSRLPSRIEFNHRETLRALGYR